MGALTFFSQRLEQNGIRIIWASSPGPTPRVQDSHGPGPTRVRPGVGPYLAAASLDPGTIIICCADATCTVVVPFSRVFAQARVMSQYAGITPVSDCVSVYAHHVLIVEVAAPFDKMTIFFEL